MTDDAGSERKKLNRQGQCLTVEGNVVLRILGGRNICTLLVPFPQVPLCSLRVYKP